MEGLQSVHLRAGNQLVDRFDFAQRQRRLVVVDFGGRSRFLCSRSCRWFDVFGVGRRRRGGIAIGLLVICCGLGVLEALVGLLVVVVLNGLVLGVVRFIVVVLLSGDCFFG